MKPSTISMVTFLVVGGWVTFTRATVAECPGPAAAAENAILLEQLSVVGQKLAKTFNPMSRSQRHEPHRCVAEAEATCSLQDTCGEAHEFPITNAPTNQTGEYNCALSDFCRNGDCQMPIGKNVCLSNCFTYGETYDKNVTIRSVVYYRSERMEYTLADVTETFDISETPIIQGCTECHSSNVAIPDDFPTGRYIVRQSHVPEEGAFPLYDFVYEFTVFNPKAKIPKDNAGGTVKNSLYILLISVSSLLLRTM